MKFESVVLEQESQGQPAAVEERRGGTVIVWLSLWSVLINVNVQKIWSPCTMGRFINVTAGEAPVRNLFF